MTDWTQQRYWEDVPEGEEIQEVPFPLPVQRMVMEAGAVYDFHAIHHNSRVAQSGGAPDMFANTTFLVGMWERAIREWIGLGGVLHKIGPFRMRTFSPAGDTVIVRGKVLRKFQENGSRFVEVEMRSVSRRTGEVTVGPGPVLVSLPSRT